MTASLERPASVEEVRDALAPLGLDDAKIQEVENPELGEQRRPDRDRRSSGPGEVAACRGPARRTSSASQRDGFSSESVGPTFGETVARSAVDRDHRLAAR